jgi:hypothetical protein
MLGECVALSLNDQCISSTLHTVVESFAVKLLNKIFISNLFRTGILGSHYRHSQNNPYSFVELEAK